LPATLVDLVHMLRWRIERDYQDLKQELLPSISFAERLLT
jgi:SRSO17 transposase